MAYVTIVDNKVTGVFNSPQPQLQGFQAIPDNDKRLQDFYNDGAAQKKTTEEKINSLTDMLVNKGAITEEEATQIKEQV